MLTQSSVCADVYAQTFFGDVAAPFVGMTVVFFLEIYRVITPALWSRGGSAVVSVHPPAAS